MELNRESWHIVRIRSGWELRIVTRNEEIITDCAHLLWNAVQDDMYNKYHNETPLVPSIQVSLRFTFASFPPARLVIIVTTVTWNVKIYRLLKLTAEADDL